jgi:hypothetical protein
MFMQSSGGLTAQKLFQGKDAILSGPAGGVVGMVETAAWPASTSSSASTWAAPRPTSAHYDGEYERAFETEVAGVRMRAPMMRIHTVAAGGGSILFYDGSRFRSARIPPAPIPARPAIAVAVPLAVTDANVMLGKLQPEHFPRVRPQPATNRWTPKPSARSSPRCAQPRLAAARLPEDVAEASCASPSRTWPTPSRRSRCSAAMTSPLRAQLFRRRRRSARLPDRRMTRARHDDRVQFMNHPSRGRRPASLSAYGMGLAGDPRPRTAHARHDGDRPCPDHRAAQHHGG